MRHNTYGQKQIHFNNVVHRTHHYSISCSGEISENEHGEISQNPQEEEIASKSICAFCNTDFGTRLNKLSVYPICDSCKVNLDKRIFPAWVKLFFAGVLVLVVFSIFWNWRFYSAYLDLKKANQASEQKNVTGAADYMTRASKEVPEAQDVGEMASYYTGIDLLTKDKSTQALKEFDNCKDLPPELHVNDLVLQAEMGSGFDKKDYKLFLTASKAFLKLDTTQAQSWAGVASAYACLYAQNNADSLKEQSLKYFNKARALDDTSAAAKEFYGRISYRLDTRQIISKEQYDQKYPKGYTTK